MASGAKPQVPVLSKVERGAITALTPVDRPFLGETPYAQTLENLRYLSHPTKSPAC